MIYLSTTAGQGKQQIETQQAQQKTPLDSLFQAFRRIAEITIYYMSEYTDEPTNFSYPGDTENFETAKFIGEKYAEKDPQAVKIPHTIKDLTIDIVDVSEASIAKKRDEIFELGQKWAAIPPPFQKVLLDLYKVGSTADILEDLEKSQTLLDSPEFQNLIAQARAGQLPPDVQQSLADLLKFLSKSAPVQDPGKAGVQSKGGPAGDPQGQPQKGQDASQPKPGQKP